jgi:protein TonB
MTSLLDSTSTDDLDHSSGSTLEYGDHTETANRAVRASTSEVYRQTLDTFEPDDGATLIRSMAASSSAHVLMALPLFIYGSLLALQPEPAPRSDRGPKATPAAFIFKMKEKPPETILKVAEAEAPVEKVIEAPKPEPKKTVKRVAKKTPRTAPRRAPKAEQQPPVVAKAAPTYVAPPSESAQGPAVALVATADPSLPSGPATPQVALELPTETAGEFDLKGALAAYKKKLSRAMKKDYTYPRAARRAGIEGRAIVRILIDAQGNVLSVELATSSGHEILDNAALEAARSVKHVPAAPDSLRWGERHIKVPFKFRSA